MATLDEKPEQFQPLDINTPVVDRNGFPTPVLLRNQQSFKRTILAQAKAINEATGEIELNTARIDQEAEVRAAADNASAILVDRVTAEALGFEAAILMKAEVGINPAGVLARYQIMVSLDPGGALVNSGMMFDVVSNGGGGYLGQIILDADKVKIGRVNTTGTFPFYLDGNTLYIENAVIRNLTIGTNKLAYNAATSIVITSPGGAVGPGGYLAGASIYNEYGAVSIDFSSFLDRPGSSSSNFGYLRVRILRNGSEITSRTLFYDDNFAYPFAFTHVDYPSVGATHTYDAQLLNLSGQGWYSMFDGVMRLINFKR